eukprot:13293310-Alexandrium_andersonii.AAC.1
MLSEASLAALRQQARGTAAAAPAAVDVEHEGPPPEEAWRRHVAAQEPLAPLPEQGGPLAAAPP